jgi:hypothetical protein
MSLSVARTVLELTDQSDWLGDPRIHLVYGADIKQAGAPFACSPFEVAKADDACIHLRDCVQSQLTKPFQHMVAKSQEKHDFKNYEENSPWFVYDWTQWEHFKYERAIVVGGGPSLKENYSWIDTESSYSDTALIACSTVLIPLLENDIDPDVVCAIDSSSHLVKHFKDADSSAILIFSPVIDPKIVSEWNGQKAVMNTTTENQLWCQGTVVHTMCDLAVKMGCKEVYLVGVDFCYPNNQSHAEGVTLTHDVTVRDLIDTVNGNGERVKTDCGLAQCRVYLEKWIANQRGVKFYKLGKSGVPLDGVEWTP